MIALKIVVTSAMVLGLAWLSERLGPRVAGVMAGFPLGIAISLFFLGVEQGPVFAAASSVSAIGGLAASLVFCMAYWKASNFFTARNVISTSLVSVFAFLIAAAMLAMLPQTIWLLTAVTLAMTGLAILLFRGIEEGGAGQSRPVTKRPAVLLARAGTATVIVLAITSLASIIGEEWSGLLSGFPITLYPVLLIVHVSHSKREAQGIIKGFPFGIGSLIIYALSASFFLVPFGVYLGSLLAVGLATAYLAVISTVLWRFRPAEVAGLSKAKRAGTPEA